MASTFADEAVDKYHEHGSVEKGNNPQHDVDSRPTGGDFVPVALTRQHTAGSDIEMEEIQAIDAKTRPVRLKEEEDFSDGTNSTDNRSSDEFDERDNLEDGGRYGSKNVQEFGEYDEDASSKVVDKSWVLAAIIISWVSIVLVMLFGIAGLTLWYTENSVAVLGFALEQWLDTVTSILILWRFGAHSRAAYSFRGTLVLNETEQDKEKRAAMLIGALFIAAGVLTIVMSVIVLITKEAPEETVPLIILATCSIVTFTILGFSKLYIAGKARSHSLLKDSWVTLLSAVLSVAILVGAFLYYHYDLWWIDAAVALPLGLILFLSGAHAFVTYRWWRKDFWIS